MKRISWKSINSWICFALLLAPGLYLFGGYIGQLAGSHGEFMYAEPALEGGIDYSVGYNGNSYDRIVYGNYYAKHIVATGEYITFGNGISNERILCTDNVYWYDEGNLVYTSTWSYLAWQDDGETGYALDEVYFDEAYECLAVWCLDSNRTGWYYELFSTGQNYYYQIAKDNQGQVKVLSMYENYNNAFMFYETYIYTYNPIQNLDWGNFERHIPETQPNAQSAPPIEPNAQGNTEFQQGQFFSRNNFLKKWGDSVVSQNETWGFAPFKALIQYLDGNMLHFASNGVQYGLMAYGYMYYALHIVLLDLVFFVASFFPRFIKKIVEKLEGGIE